MSELSLPAGAAQTPALGPTRRGWCLGAASLLGLAGCSSLRQPAGPSAAARHDVAPFSGARLANGLPVGWRLHVTRPDLPITHYTLDRLDGRTVVHSVAERATSGLRCDVDIDPADRPWLSWDWRVDRCPPEASTAQDESDDSPARVVVAFDGDHARLPLGDRLFAEQVALFTGQVLPYATLSYVWDGQAPVDSVHQYIRSSRIRYLVVESGEARAGRWLHYRRNLVDDFLRVFGEAPGRIIGVGVMTDSDDLKNRAEAWFGDLTIG